MKNIEKYPKTADALRAYNAYTAANMHRTIWTMCAWLKQEAELSEEERKSESESPASYRSAPYLTDGMMGLAALIAPLLAGGAGRNKIECGVDTSGGESVHVKIDIEHTTGKKLENDPR